MKQIKILLSSALTLLLITGNNVSYAYAYELKNVQFQGNKSNMRVSPNRVNQGALRKGVVNKRNAVIPVNRINQAIRNTGNGVILQSGSIGKRTDRDSILGQANQYNPTSKYSISDEPAFIPKPAFRINQSNDDASGLGFRNSLEHGPGLHDSVHCVNNSIKQIDGKNFACKNNNWLGPLGGDGVFSRGVNERSSVIIGDNHFKEGITVTVEDAGVIIGDNNFIGQAGKDGILGQANGYNCKDVSGNCLDKSTPKFGGQEGEAFNPTSKYSISDEPAFVPKPKGVRLKFINGEWR